MNIKNNMQIKTYNRDGEGKFTFKSGKVLQDAVSDKNRYSPSRERERAIEINEEVSKNHREE